MNRTTTRVTTGGNLTVHQGTGWNGVVEATACNPNVFTTRNGDQVRRTFHASARSVNCKRCLKAA